MNLTLTDFRGARDLDRVKTFLRGRSPWTSLPDYWTGGKSTVAMFQIISDSPVSHHKFWRDEDGDFHAHLWLYPEPSKTVGCNGRSWRLTAHPRARTAPLVNAAIACAEARLPELTGQKGARSRIETVAYGEDAWLGAVLAEHGYQRREAQDVYMMRSLGNSFDEPDLAAGYTIRPLNPPDDIVQRAGAQRDAFAGAEEPDAWALDNTRRFLRWYEGRNDLDLVAVAATGDIAAFAVFLVDPGTGVGELDPVGTRAAHQRRGLSKALLLTGLRFLKSEGMDFAAVRTEIANTAAIRTYESAGFDVVDQLYRYTKRLD